MRSLQAYIDRIMDVADLAHWDEKRVRRELYDHLQDILEMSQETNMSEEDIMSAVEQEFGNPTELGRAIARAKGKFRTYLKKQARMAPASIAVALIVGFTLRAVWIQSYRAMADDLAPMVSKGDHLLVNKLASRFEQGDIVVYEENDRAVIAIVKRSSRSELVLDRKSKGETTVSRDEIKGRVINQWRKWASAERSEPQLSKDI